MVPGKLPSLKQFESVSIMAVNLWFPEPNLKPPGFGYLIPRSVSKELNPHHALGVFFDSDIGNNHPEEPEGTKLFVLMGGHHYEDPSVKIPQYEVISVKPSKGNETRIQITPDGLRGTEVTTQFLLMEAFGGINQNQLVGEPSWATTDGFDIEAKVDAADLPTMAKLTFDQRRTMFQQILTDRYRLVFHHETRELPVYRLVLGKNGPKLKQAAQVRNLEGDQVWKLVGQVLLRIGTCNKQEAILDIAAA